MEMIAHVFLRVGLLSALAVQALAGEYGIVARVNGENVDAQRFESFYQAFLQEKGRNAASIRDPRAFKQLRDEALDAYLDEELLWQEARRLGAAATPEEIEADYGHLRGKFSTDEAFSTHLQTSGLTEASLRDQLARRQSIQHLIEKTIAPGVTASPRDIHKFYEANRARFTVPKQVRIRHILMKVAPGADAAEQERVRQRMQEILREAKRDKTDFGDLAKRYSEDTSAAQGGDLGFISPGQTVPAFEQAAFALKDREISDVVKTPFGLHLLRAESHRQGQLKEADVRETIGEMLRAEKLRQAVRQRLAELRRSARIEWPGGR